MKNYLKNWNFLRILRLAIAIFIIYQGIQSKEWMFILAGAIFAIMPLFNVGCCGTSSCNVPISKTNKNLEDITYEEVR